MTKKRIANNLTILLLIVVAIVFIFNSSIYSQTCLSAVSVWATRVFPCMFPFFVISRSIAELIDIRSTKLDKLFIKIYHAEATSSSIFLLSLISGYPMGAKLISTMHDKGIYNKQTCQNMLSFCSIGGPMFMVGTIGVGMLLSLKCGFVILFANVLASLTNGFLHCKKQAKNTKSVVNLTKEKSSFSDVILDSLTSIFMVGCYIIISFLLVEMLKSFNLLDIATNAICCVFNNHNIFDVVQASIISLIEITTGSLTLSVCVCSLRIKVILLSGLVGFGGLCIFLQTLNYTNKIGIEPKVILWQKTTQAILSTLYALLLCLLLNIS